MNPARGFSLITALFLVVALSALATYAVNLGGQQQASAVLAVKAAAAYQAAQSGLEWASYRALNGGSCGSSSFALDEGSGAGFTVASSCTSTTHRIRNQDLRYYRIQVTASQGSFGDPFYVSRTVSGVVGEMP